MTKNSLSRAFLFLSSLLLPIIFVTSVEPCYVQKSTKTLSAGSLSTPAPPSPVVSNCGHNKYYHKADVPGVGVVGGQNIEPNQYPWVARLKIAETGTSDTMLCGSSVINNLWLLTAAHCVDGANPSDITAIFADYDRTVPDTGEYGLKVVNITIHRQYNSNTQDYDFALLKLSSYLSFLDWKTQKICLPQSCSDGCATGTYAYVGGWGTTSESSNTPPDIMQSGLVKIVEKTSCRSAYSNLGRGITDRMTCAAMSGVDTCSGDSGGPLMTVEDGFYKLCGLTSFGNGCARDSYPGVYSRVCSVLDWIKNNSIM